MVKIDFKEVIMAGKTPKPVLITLGIDWAIKSFTMYLIAGFFLGVVFRDLLSGTEIVKGGDTVELWRSYVSGAILLGVTPCTAMVLMWGYLVKGNDRSGKTFERRHHMTIQILGTGCPRCKKLEENARKAVNELAISCKIEKVTDLNEIMEYGIIMTPGLAIDKKVKSVGKVLTPEQIKAFITGRGR
jgi:small redox-active disulfide protein 2